MQLSRFAFALSMLGAVCDGSLMVRGRVVGCEDQRPLDNALVVSYGESNHYKHSTRDTEKDGSFSIAVNQDPKTDPTVLVVSKKGYEAQRRDVSDIDKPQDICLRRVTR